MKGGELLPQVGAALSSNDVCVELNLAGCNLDDTMLEPLTQALKSNSSLTSLSLEANRINNDGAILIARALKTNRSLLVLNMQNQKGTRFGDTTLGEFTAALEQNVTLLKIVWRCAPCDPLGGRPRTPADGPIPVRQAACTHMCTCMCMCTRRRTVQTHTRHRWPGWRVGSRFG